MGIFLDTAPRNKNYFLSPNVITNKYRVNYSLKDVTVICLSAFLDGLSTTSPSLLFCLYCLAIDQRVQDKFSAEIVKVVGNDPETPITSQHIAKMPYLKAFVKETFRYQYYLVWRDYAHTKY